MKKLMKKLRLDKCCIRYSQMAKWSLNQVYYW